MTGTNKLAAVRLHRPANTTAAAPLLAQRRSKVLGTASARAPLPSHR
jgi:hypothetical protein